MSANGTTYLVHIVAGSLGILSGFVALYSAKGAPLHRKAGMVFVYVMLTTTMAGLLMAIVRGVAPAVNVPAAIMTSYLVITGVTTVRRPMAWPRWLDPALMLVALAVAVVEVTFAFEALTTGKSHGFPAFPFMLFGTVGLLGVAGDLRVLRSESRKGASRLVRHLWRMSMALWIAALSFFIGQAKVFPKPIRTPALLALPVLAVLLTMIYWLWRFRRRSVPRSIMTRVPEPVET